MQIKTVRTQGTPPHIPVIEPLSIPANGTYTAPTGVDGYSPITVDVQEEPWAPLEDGYSNFWFELTDDTLSPWLNFSAKNNDAVIDWGDGSGEVALDTLTPTHTYSKAGKYVVKVKGVTAIAQQHNVPYNSVYLTVLKYVELANEVTNCGTYRNCCGLRIIRVSPNSTMPSYCFLYCGALEKVIGLQDIGNMGSAQIFQNCFSLQNVAFPQSVQNIGTNICSLCYSIKNVTIPSAVTNIGSGAFGSCSSLEEIHCQPTSPPSLGSSNPFSNIASNYIIYVPVGTGDTYKAAAGWSAYADHIVEEGQTLSRAALRRIQASEKTTDESEGDDVR